MGRVIGAIRFQREKHEAVRLLSGLPMKTTPELRVMNTADLAERESA